MVVGKNRRYKDGSTNRQAAKIAYRLPLHTLKEEYTGYHQLQWEGESLFSAFGTILNKLASSIDAQTSATKLAMENGEDAKEAALPGTLPTKVKKAFAAGEYVNLMALWDREIAKARP